MVEGGEAVQESTHYSLSCRLYSGLAKSMRLLAVPLHLAFPHMSGCSRHSIGQDVRHRCLAVVLGTSACAAFAATAAAALTGSDSSCLLCSAAATVRCSLSPFQRRRFYGSYIHARCSIVVLGEFLLLLLSCSRSPLSFLFYPTKPNTESFLLPHNALHVSTSLVNYCFIL